MRAVQPLDARHPLHERLHRFHHHWVWNGRLQRCAGGGKIGGFVRGAQQAVVADTLQTAGQNMLHEAPDELARIQAYDLLAVAIGRVAHPQAHLVSIHAEDALIGDRYPVRVATEILQYLRRAAQLSWQAPFEGYGGA